MIFLSCDARLGTVVVMIAFVGSVQSWRHILF